MSNDLHNHIANIVKREVLRDVGVEPLNENWAPSKEILICRGNWGTDNQNLTESPDIYQTGTFSIFVDPTETHNTNYFKVYKGKGPDNNKGVCRIAVNRIEYVTGHSGPEEFTLNNKQKKELIRVLKQVSKKERTKGKTNYNAIIFHLNEKLKGWQIRYDAVDIDDYKDLP